MTRTALVTGGNRGIGLEICRQLARDDHTVLLGARDGALGKDAAAGLRDKGHDVTTVALDVADDASVASCAAALAADGVAIDVLVNNAGVIAEGELLSGGTEPMDQAIAVKLMGPYRTARAFMPAMGERG